ATWALISIGRKELGWIDKRALDIEKITDEKNVSYIAALTRGRDNITSKPYGTEDYKIVDKASSYLNQDVKVIKEATTKRATWAFITLNGKELGWIDKRALTQFEQINQTKAAHYLAKVIRGTDSIGSEPYGTNGFKKLGMSSAYLNKQVEIKQEAVTDRATWAMLF
ncbi:MAG: SH3-like domain-containing protein, partial [Pisciglobus halotolerans]|nr:SH3-like domain-containing protein [Pisciglobus halotolerans]